MLQIPPYFTVFGRVIPMYGLMMYIGIGVAAGVAFLIRRRNKIEAFDLTCSAIYTLIGAMVGAKVLFLIVSWKQVIELGLGLMEIIQGGFVFYGGLIGGILGLFIYCKRYRLSFGQFADLYATVLPLGHAFGRVGCFIAGCCYGMEYHGSFSYTYESVMGGNTPLGVPLFPVQLIEASLLVLLFGVQLLLYFRKSRRCWDQVIYYAMAYALIRFTLEFFRGDAERGSAWLFSTSQWISLLLFAGAVALVIFRSKKRIADTSEIVTTVAEESAVESVTDTDGNGT